MRCRIAALAAMTAALAHAVPIDQWDARMIPPTAHDVTIYRGESWEFQPRFTTLGAAYSIPTGSTVTLYWSTNNWAGAYATNGTVLAETGRVSATWSSACDVGASNYAYFVAVSEPSGMVYRAMGRIRMLESPGFRASGSPAPVGAHPTFSDLYAVSNIAASAVSTNRSITINGVRGVLDSNLVFTVTAATDYNAITQAVAGLALTGATWTAQTGSPTWTNGMLYLPTNSFGGGSSGGGTDGAAVSNIVAGIMQTGSVSYATTAGSATDATARASAAVALTNWQARMAVAEVNATNAQGIATNALAQAQAAQVTANAASATGATHTAQLAVIGPLATNAYVSATNGQALASVALTNWQYQMTVAMTNWQAALYASNAVAMTNWNAAYQVALTNWQAAVIVASTNWQATTSALSAQFANAVTNGGATINGAPITNGAAITVAAALPAGAIVATNQGVAGQSFFFSQGTPSGVSTGYFASAAGAGDMLKSEYDAGGVKQVAFTNDARIVNALTNAAAFATAAQGVSATNAQQRVGVLETNTVTLAATNGWTVSNHSAFVTTNGARMGGALYSDLNYLSTAPAQDEFATAGWVRSLTMQGAQWYFSGTITNGFGEKTANFVALRSSPDGVVTNTIAAPASSSYFVGGITTQLYGEVRSPISFDVWAYRSGAALTLPCHPEIYYVYDGTTNQLGDWSTGDQNIAASTTPTRYTWTVSFADPSITGAVRIVGYLRAGTVTGSGSINILGGGSYDSHMDIAGAPVGQSAGEVAAALTAHTNQTIAGGVHGGLPSYVLTNAAAFDAAGAAATVQTNLGTFATSQTNVNNAVSAALSTFTNNAVTNYNAGGVQLNSNLFVMGRAAIGTNTATQVLDVAGQVSAHDIVNKKGRSVSRIAMDGRVPYVGGRTWQAVNTITNGIWGLCWSSELGVFVGGGTGGQLWISTNGTDWAATTNYSGATANFRTITWSPELGLFVLLPWVTSGSGNYYISRDGINWTASGTTTYTWVNACWSSELRLFVAIAFQSKVVGTSPDGINWTITDISSQAGDASAYGIAWSPELRLFVVTTQGGTSNPVLTSPDGVTWTARTSAGNSTWNSVCWSSELRLFCSVASAGASYRIQTSADGIAWGGVNAPAANSWQGVCWSPEIRLFCAVAGSGTGTRGMTSPDGTNWTIRTSAADNNWRNVVWSPELRRFLAGSSTATTNRVMVSGVEDYARISGLRSPNGYGLDLDGALIVSNGVVSATGNVVVAGTITATGGIYVAGTHVATNIVSADASVTIVRNVGGFDLSVAPSTNSGLTASQVASFMLTNAAGTASALAPGSASNTLAAAITNGGNVALAAVYGSNAVSGAIQTYTATNPTIALSPTNCAIAWIPTESNATMQVTFTIPGAGYAGSGILRLVNTNVNTIIWTNTPNVYWYNNGTRTLSPPTLSIYNRIVVDWFDGMLTLGLVSTNAAPTP